MPACPYGVIEQRPSDGRAFKCTMCYDRLGAGQEPACAKARRSTLRGSRCSSAAKNTRSPE